MHIKNKLKGEEDMYNNESNQGMLIIKSDISDYLNRIYTADGKYPNGICLAPLSKSIIANSVVGHHLYELFNISDSFKISKNLFGCI